MKSIYGRSLAPLAITGALLWPLLAASVEAAPEVAARVEAAAQRLLSEQAAHKGLVEPEFKLNLVTSPQPLTPCQLPVSVEPVDTRYLSRMRFAVKCPGKDGWQRDWIVRAEVTALVVVAATDVPANRALSEDDLAQERRRLTDMAEAVSTLKAVVGQSSTRALRTGQVVLPNFLALPILVKRGDSVTIRARSGAVEVNAAGEALEPGRRGDFIRVRNSSTGKVIRARVLNSGMVEPEGMAEASEAQSED